MEVARTDLKKQKVKKKKPFSAKRMAIKLGAYISLTIGLITIVYIVFSGLRHLSFDLFRWTYTNENQSMLPSIINTLIIIVFSLGLALPLGIFTAIYLIEYQRKDSRLVKIIRLTTQSLAGIPSIIYGIFGYLLFVIQLKFSYSILSGALTLSLMILPLIIRTTEEALISVDDSLREASLALGASKTQTIYKLVLPSGRNGILSGIILAIGKIVGETAALIYTAGTFTDLALNPMQSGRTLSVHLYRLMSEGLYMDQAKAVSLVLLVIVLAINFLSKKLIQGGKNGTI